MDNTCIRIEGGLLSPDFLERLHDRDGQKPKDFGLDARRSIVDEISIVWADAQTYWKAFERRRAHASAESATSASATTITRDQWVIPLLETLGYTLTYQRRNAEADGKTYAISHRARPPLASPPPSRGENAPSPQPIEEEGDEGVPVHIVGYGQELGSRPTAGRGSLSPHGLVQDYLNRSEHVWGIVTNGYVLRLLRDSSYFTRPAYIEFDLKQMLEGGRLDEFILFYRLVHRTRLPQSLAEADRCWLERYHQTAIEQGGRIRDGLRDAVEQTIVTLANGFLKHPKNEGLRARIRANDLSAREFYRQLLYVIYRLLFLLVAEERNLLIDPKADRAVEAAQFYRENLSLSRLRTLAAEPLTAPERFDDLYLGLRTLFYLLADETAAAQLGLPALNGELFGELRDLDGAQLSNRDLLDAIGRISTFTPDDERVRRRVNYAALDVEELGSVYESLLEYQPVLRTTGPTIEFAFAAGTERKSTASYYTPPQLVNELIQSALLPVLNERLQAAKTADEKQRAILSIKVLDPACGSGHFLLAAARALGRELARVSSGADEPSPEATRLAVRQVITHCVYGVDKNPLAVDLCKVALWLEGHAEGKPLTFLDHRVRCGDSLVGVHDLAVLHEGIPAAAFEPVTGDDKKIVTILKKRNRAEKLQYGLPFDAVSEVAQLSSARRVLTDIPDDSPKSIRRKKQAYAEVQQQAEHDRVACHLWTYAFFAPLTSEEVKANGVPTTDVVRQYLATGAIDGRTVGRAEAAAENNRFFHWPLEFPEVLAEGGFDVIISNPPWEKIKLQEREWFATRRADIATAQNSAVRKRMINDLIIQNPDMYHEFVEAKRESEGESNFLRNSGIFRFGASGDTNTYPLFIELAEPLIKQSGRIGLIVKTGILADYSMKDFFVHLVESRRLVSAYDFSNKKLIFPAVVANERFTLLTLGGYETTDEFRVSILNEEVADLKIPERMWSLSVPDLPLINPNTRTCPLFRSTKDYGIVRKIYERFPILINESPDKQSNPWQCIYYTMFHMTNDSHLFSDLETLQRSANTSSSPDWLVSDVRYLALFEGKLFDIFDYQHGTFAGIPRENRFGIKAEPNHPDEISRADPAFECLPRYWVPAEEVHRHYQEKLGYVPSAVLAFRDVCRTHTDLRTVRASIVPAWGFGNKAPLILFIGSSKEEHSRKSLGLCSNLTSFVFDYVSRQKFAGGSLNRYILIQLPIIAPTSEACQWSPSESVFDWLNRRALELAYTTWALQPFASDCGYDGPPFAWNEERRFMIRCELDAAYFHLYGIARDDVDYIMETFPIFRRNDEAVYSEYRTKHVILDLYDEMSKAMQTGQPYSTRLDPPPAALRADS